MDNDKILVLGATNLPWILDSAIRRRLVQNTRNTVNVLIVYWAIALSCITKQFAILGNIRLFIQPISTNFGPFTILLK